MRAIPLLLDLHGGKCFYCGTPLAPMRHGTMHRELSRSPRAATVDHLVPKSRGGSNALTNLVPACLPCNTEKGDRLPTLPELLRLAGRLSGAATWLRKRARKILARPG